MSHVDLSQALTSLPDGQLKIIEAAVVEFAEKGYSAASTRAIAQKAGVSEALIFKYFKSKQNLLHNILKPMLAQAFLPIAIGKVQNLLENEYPTFEKFARIFLSERIEFALSYRNYIRIVIQELPLNKEIQQMHAREFRNNIWPKFRKLIRACQKSGELRPIRPMIILRTMVSLFMGLVLPLVLIEKSRTSKRNLEREIDMTVDILMNAVRNHKETK